MLRLEVFDEKGQHNKELSVDDLLSMANKKKGAERIQYLERAAFLGCKDLEIYNEIIR